MDATTKIKINTVDYINIQTVNTTIRIFKAKEKMRKTTKRASKRLKFLLKGSSKLIDYIFF